MDALLPFICLTEARVSPLSPTYNINVPLLKNKSSVLILYDNINDNVILVHNANYPAAEQTLFCADQL